METNLQEKNLKDTTKIGFWGGDKEGYKTAFQMAWPAVMESFFISFAEYNTLAFLEVNV